MSNLPQFPWPLSEYLFWDCEPNSIYSDAMVAVARNDTAKLEEKIIEWRKFDDKDYFYAHDVLLKCWLFIIRRRQRDWVNASRAFYTLLTKIDDYVVRHMIGTASRDLQPTRVAFATMAFAAAVRGDERNFEAASRNAVEFGEPPETMAFFENLLARNRGGMLAIAAPAIKKAENFGSFYSNLLEILCGDAFFTTLGYVAPTEDTPVAPRLDAPPDADRPRLRAEPPGPPEGE